MNPCCQIQALEGQVRNKTGILTSYSEQMIVDCYNTSAGYGGCNGGYMEDVFSLINKYKGIAKETAYPYNGAVSLRCSKNQETCWVILLVYKVNAP